MACDRSDKELRRHSQVGVGDGGQRVSRVAWRSHPSTPRRRPVPAGTPRSTAGRRPRSKERTYYLCLCCDVDTPDIRALSRVYTHDERCKHNDRLHFVVVVVVVQLVSLPACLVDRFMSAAADNETVVHVATRCSRHPLTRQYRNCLDFLFDKRPVISLSRLQANFLLRSVVSLSAASLDAKCRCKVQVVDASLHITCSLNNCDTFQEYFWV